MREERRRIGA